MLLPCTPPRRGVQRMAILPCVRKEIAPLDILPFVSPVWYPLAGTGVGYLITNHLLLCSDFENGSTTPKSYLDDPTPPLGVAAQQRKAGVPMSGPESKRATKWKVTCTNV